MAKNQNHKKIGLGGGGGKGHGEWGLGWLVIFLFDKESNFKIKKIFFVRGGGGGGEGDGDVFLLIDKNPNLKERGGGERKEGKCTYMNKCFKWQIYSSRRTTVTLPNYFEIHALM